MPPETATPTSDDWSPRKRSVPRLHAKRIATTPTPKMRFRGSSHRLFSMPYAGLVQMLHHTQKITVARSRLETCGLGPSHSQPDALRKPPTHPSTSLCTCGDANDRGTSVAIGSNTSGASQTHTHPASTPGTVMQSGMIRCRMSIHVAAARSQPNAKCAAYRSTRVADTTAVGPPTTDDGNWPSW